VFENGRVIENGTFDELVAKGGRFAELARAQFMVHENQRGNSRENATENAMENARANTKGTDGDHAAVNA